MKISVFWQMFIYLILVHIYRCFGGMLSPSSGQIEISERTFFRNVRKHYQITRRHVPEDTIWIRRQKVLPKRPQTIPDYTSETSANITRLNGVMSQKTIWTWCQNVNPKRPQTLPDYTVSHPRRHYLNMKPKCYSETSANITRLHGVTSQKTLFEYEGRNFFRNVRKHYQITRCHVPEDTIWIWRQKILPKRPQTLPDYTGSRPRRHYLNTKAECSSETSANITRLHGVTSQKTLTSLSHYRGYAAGFYTRAQLPTEETLSSIPGQIGICDGQNSSPCNPILHISVIPWRPR
jgi:hypothetical protein